jgi:sec-independent protein translocase protein TatC
MPFLDHLEELRHRLFYCAIAVAVGAAVAVVLFKFIPGFDVIRFLSKPITPYLPNGKLQTLHPGDAFQIVLDAGFAVAMVVASPVIIYQIWGFISPALYSHEKKVVVPVIFGIVFLFISGVVIAFTLILPLTIKFLMGVETQAFNQNITASDFFGFEIFLCVAFGAAFELPIVLMGLTAIGLVTPMFLAKYRRFAIVGALIAGTFITPDPTSMVVIALPLYFLYELSIILSRSVYKWRLRRENGEDDNSRPPDPPRPPSLPSQMSREPRRLGT